MDKMGDEVGDKGGANACGTALPMNRASLRCLGLAVGIAFAGRDQ